MIFKLAFKHQTFLALGAFLIPYIIFMIICGTPLFFLELAVAQYSSASPLSLWQIAPLFKGKLVYSFLSFVIVPLNVLVPFCFAEFQRRRPSTSQHLRQNPSLLLLPWYSSVCPLDASSWLQAPQMTISGLGWSMIIISGIVCIYYNVILTWVFYYLVRSMNREVPWKFCGNVWNTCLCHRLISDTKPVSI